MAPPQIRDGMNARIPVKFMLIYSLAFLRIYSKDFLAKINISYQYIPAHHARGKELDSGSIETL